MTKVDRTRHERDAAGYMRNCTDNQLDGVIETEKARIQRAPQGEVADVARIMLRAAQTEKERRGLA